MAALTSVGRQRPPATHQPPPEALRGGSPPSSSALASERQRAHPGCGAQQAHAGAVAAEDAHGDHAGPLVDLAVWSLAVLVLILVVFPSRQVYLVMALGIPLLSVSMLSLSFLGRFLSGTWRAVALASLGAIVLFAPTTVGAYSALYEASAEAIPKVKSALAEVDRQEPVLVEGTGVMAAGAVMLLARRRRATR